MASASQLSMRSVYVNQAGLTQPWLGHYFREPQSFKSSKIQSSRHAAMAPVEAPMDVSSYPLSGFFRRVRLPVDPGPQLLSSTMKASLAILAGCWRIELLVNPQALSGAQERPEHYFPINFSTQGCATGNLTVRGRVYNMTVSEVRLDSVENGVVTARALRYYSNFRPLRGVAIEDELVHHLVKHLRLVNYDSKSDIVYLSDGQTTAQLVRDPGYVS